MSSDGKTSIKTDEELQIKFLPVAESLTDTFLDRFPAYKTGIVRGEPGGFVISPEYGPNATDVWKFLPREDDVWVLSFPKSGWYCSNYFL